MGRTSRGDNKSKQQRQQTILRLIQENPCLLYTSPSPRD